MAGLSRVGRRLWSFAWRNALPQIAVSSAATVIGSLVIATLLPGGRNPAPPQPVAEQARPAAVPLAQLWPRQDPARLFSLSLELTPGGDDRDGSGSRRGRGWSEGADRCAGKT